MTDRELMNRPNWNEYFLNIAKVVATRGTCDRLQVGAVITNSNRIISTGYNGAPNGSPHCDENNHGMGPGHTNCQNVVHAEINAIAQAAAIGVSLRFAVMYVTVCPCINCMRVIANTGITRVFYGSEYKPDSRVPEVAAKAFVRLTHYPLTPTP